jgi:iron(III) transport system permease protein
VLYNLEEAGLASQASAVAVVIVAVVTAAMLALDALGKYLPAGTLPWHSAATDVVLSREKHDRKSTHAGTIAQVEPRPVLSA